MKTGKRFLTVLSVAVLSAGLLFAGSAEKEYSTFVSDIENGSFDHASASYERFMRARDKDLNNLYKQLDKARSKNNRDLYYETLDRINDIKSMGMTKAQSDEMLALIVENGDEEDAAWLYDNSPYYQPVLSFSFEMEKPNFRSSGKRSFALKPGSEIVLPTQEDIGVRTTEYGVLKGWGLMPGMVTYAPGEKILMPPTSQTLYAVWENGVSFTDEIAGIDDYSGSVEDGDVIQIPSVPHVSGNMIFAGWWDPSTGEFIPEEETEYEVRGYGASFEALYAGLEVKDPKTSPYRTIPSGTQVALSFDIENTGNEKLSDLNVKISSADPDVKFLDDEYVFRSIPVGRTGRVNTNILYTGTQNGKELPVDVTVTDGDGRRWTGSFALKSK